MTPRIWLRIQRHLYYACTSPLRFFISFSALLVGLYILFYFILCALFDLRFSQHETTIGPVNTQLLKYGPIDAVYTWVNGSDPRWKKEKKFWNQRWLAQLEGSSDFSKTEDDNLDEIESNSHSDNRYRDNEELRYSLRSLEKYAPWLRHIYIVTDGQIPSWLDLDNSKISIIKHSAIFENKSHLPVFSSPAIESNLDNIPGLSEYFVYFNDDVFLGAPVWPEDFVSTTGIQRVYLSWDVPSCKDGCRDQWIGDGFCDKACNNPECDYDLGDCKAENEKKEELQNLNSTFTEVNSTSSNSATVPVTLQPHECASDCIYTLLGDGNCNSSCLQSSCGYDSGDCNKTDIFKLWSGAVVKNNTLIVVPRDMEAILLDLSNFLNGNKVISAFHDNHNFIKHASVHQQQEALVLVLGRDEIYDLRTLSAIIHIYYKDQETEVYLNLHIIRGEKWSFDSLSSTAGVYITELTANELMANVAVELKVTEDNNGLDIISSIPLHDIDDWSLNITTTVFIQSHETELPAISPQITTCAVSPSNLSYFSSCVIDSGHLYSTFLFLQNITSNDTAAFKRGIIDGNLCIVVGEGLSKCLKFSYSYGHLDIIFPSPPVPLEIDAFIIDDNRTAKITHNLNESIIAEETRNITTPDDTNLTSTFFNDSLSNTSLLNEQHNFTSKMNIYCSVAQQYMELLKVTCGLNDNLLLNNTSLDNENDSDIPCDANEKSDIDREMTWFRKSVERVRRVFGLHTLEKSSELSPDCRYKHEVIKAQPIVETIPVSTDTFGDSLKYVNKLYNAEFGRSKTPRQVPSHMPHMINKKIMREMKTRWKDEFHATSSHRFRHPQDMQFSFSYFYFLMNRNKHVPLEQIWSRYLDVNGDGILDANEILTVASLAWGDYPPSHYIEEVEKCLTPFPQEKKIEEETAHGKIVRLETFHPHVQYSDLLRCPTIVKRLEDNVRKEAQHELMTEKEVTFQMLSDDFNTAWNQLQGIRARRTKFVCMNDDMKNPSTDVANILHQLFISFWPKRSQFELPYHLRNRFTHTDDYYQARTRQRIYSFISISLVVVAVLILLREFFLTEEKITEDEKTKD